MGKNSDDSNFATSPDIKVLANKLLGGGKKTKDSDEKISNSIDSTQTITLTIERKTFTDLKASMANGRYHEQKSNICNYQKALCSTFWKITILSLIYLTIPLILECMFTL